ncbi:hypothetical protein QIA17_05350 (plasmid) [Borreliella californiensis]|uniref:Uncharacterized protein n=1 Tax=Borreliella californiensis TaxID=373543 RepID=A0A7X0DPW5_9SPIR|nr:hypothetical protein [Borreliella californiensis]MBB6213614.1 hypothetical protein [Borreliella californiensis]MBB6213633.1 hypothetical protein [Borreliella californiensis]
MNAIKNINELLDAVDVKNALLKGLESSFGSEKLDIVNEGMTFTSSLLKFILYIKDKIEKNNEDQAAVEQIDKRLKDTIELSIRAYKAYKDSGGDFSEYKKLLKLRDEITSKMLKDLQNQVQGSK